MARPVGTTKYTPEEVAERQRAASRAYAALHKEKRLENARRTQPPKGCGRGNSKEEKKEELIEAYQM